MALLGSICTPLRDRPSRLCMGQLCSACCLDQETLARERAAEQEEQDARLAETLQREEFALRLEEDRVGASRGEALLLPTRGDEGNASRHSLRQAANVPAASAGWDFRNLLWEPFPNHRDLDATLAQRRQHLQLHRQQWPQQQPHLQLVRRRLPGPLVHGVPAQHINAQQRSQSFVAFPDLVATQPSVANHRSRAAAVGLLGELFGHQHVRDPAALFDLLGGLEHVPRGVDSAVVNANTTTLIHQASAVERSGGALQSQCSVCLEQFKQGEELRMLPCMHRYHRVCIDRWLAQNAACPVCKHEITR